ncbi:hypothetical protein BJ742DRAFT_738029 [Cladochytrium replicatum]|nr:hypothetical protein BJ742DRAFT_738029 [Cladochytrium replicatum]
MISPTRVDRSVLAHDELSSEQDGSNIHGSVASETSKLEQAKRRILERRDFRNAFQQVHPTSPTSVDPQGSPVRATRSSRRLQDEKGDHASISDPLRELLLQKQPQFITSLPPSEHHAFFHRSRASSPVGDTFDPNEILAYDPVPLSRRGSPSPIMPGSPASPFTPAAPGRYHRQSMTSPEAIASLEVDQSWKGAKGRRPTYQRKRSLKPEKVEAEDLEKDKANINADTATSKRRNDDGINDEDVAEMSSWYDGEAIQTYILFFPEEYTIPDTASWKERIEVNTGSTCVGAFNIRYSEEDGLYAFGYPAGVLKKNIQKLENRLRATELNYGLKWFGPDQRLLCTPVPIRRSLTRQQYSEHITTSSIRMATRSDEVEKPLLAPESQQTDTDVLALVRRPAYVPSRYQRIYGNPDNSFVLIFEIASVAFEEHPLMGPELREAKELEGLVLLLQERSQLGVVSYLDRKLQALKRGYEEHKERLELEDESPSHEPQNVFTSRYAQRKFAETEQSRKEKRIRQQFDQKRHALEEIIQTRLLRDMEMQSDRLLELKILKCWESLKSHRALQGFTTTSVHISVHSTSTSKERDKEMLEAEMEAELTECLELHEIQQVIARREHDRREAKWQGKNVLKVEAGAFAPDGSGSPHRSLLHAGTAAIDEYLTEERAGRSSSRHSSKRSRSGLNKDDETSEAKNSRRDRSPSKRSQRLASDATSIKSRQSSLSNDENTSAVEKRMKSANNDIDPGPFIEKRFRADRIKKKIRKVLNVVLMVMQFSQSCAAAFILLENSWNSYLKHKRKPDDPDYWNSELPEAVFTASILQDEQLRRQEIKETYISIKLFYNDKEIMTTQPVPLNPLSFSAQLSQDDILGTSKAKWYQNEAELEKTSNVALVAVEVREVPESIRAEIVQYDIVRDGFLGEVYIPIPSPADVFNALDRGYKSLQFTGPPFVSSPTRADVRVTNERLWVSGKLVMNVCWGVDDKGATLGPASLPFSNSSAPMSTHLDPFKTLSTPGSINLRKLMEWTSEIKIDPNDPANDQITKLSSLFAALENRYGISVDEFWREQQTFRLKLPTAIAEAALYLGGNEPKGTDKLQKVPEASSSPKESFESKLQLWDQPLTSTEDVSKRPSPEIAEQIQSLKFLKRIRAHQLLLAAHRNECPRVTDVVREERLPEPEPGSSLFEHFFRPNRPLKPYRTERTNLVTGQADRCSIIIQISRAFNVPVRKKTSGIKDVAVKPGSQYTVRSYMEASFQNKRGKTSVCDGPNPQWNEVVELEISAPNNDFRPESILNGEISLQYICLNLFDEYSVDMIEDDRDRDRKIHQRRERNWLGNLRIPFSTLYERIRIEGAFRMNVPPLTLAYERSTNSFDSTILGIDSNETMIHLFITLEPPLVQPRKRRLKLLTDEDASLRRHCLNWMKSLPYPKRNVVTTTLDMSGRTVFACRYISPQNPPEGINTVSQVARYVAAIPFLSGRTALAATTDLWATCEQLLDIGAADCIEHAILLCNFFLWMGKDAYVLFGHGSLEGRTAYVLLMNSNQPSAQEGVATKKSSTNLQQQTTPSIHVTVEEPRERQADVVIPAVDTSLLTSRNSLTSRITSSVASITSAINSTMKPLSRSVLQKQSSTISDEGTSMTNLFSQQQHCTSLIHQIWANIQKSVDPSRLNWDLSSSSNWKPIFDQSYPNPDLTSVQVSSLTYEDLPRDYIRGLEVILERTLMGKIEEWRSHRLTRWNSRIFKVMLSKLENELANGIELSIERLKSVSCFKEFQSLSAVYSINGFSLNMPFTDIGAVVEAAQSTDVYSSNAPDGEVEFAVAIDCHGYPGRFISVWVYIASLTRLNTVGSVNLKPKGRDNIPK